LIEPGPHPLRLSIQASFQRELRAALQSGWTSGIRSGIVVYDPGSPDVEIVSQPPYRYHYLPARAQRPGARKDTSPPAEGLRLPHAPCPFDGEDFVRDREIVRLERAGRTYHVACNRYPVTPLHFLPVRSAGATPERLPQHIHGPEEIEDLLLIAAMAGPPYRAYFNSNRGRDGSQSGSSVNHWHGQLFPIESGARSLVATAEPKLLRIEEGLRVGTVEGWPARHIVVDGSLETHAPLASVLWRETRALNELNVAYNVEIVTFRDGRLRAFLFPRSPAPDACVPGAGDLTANFGGWEMSGDIVIPTREILEWIRRNPADAERLTAKRLRETTRAVG
jgi:hypothetical protein